MKNNYLVIVAFILIIVLFVKVASIDEKIEKRVGEHEEILQGKLCATDECDGYDNRYTLEERACIFQRYKLVK